MNEEQQVLLKNGTAMVVNSAASIGASVIVHNVSTPPIRSGELKKNFQSSQSQMGSQKRQFRTNLKP
ncbi:hypothetical protein RUM43_004083 [Polyplax serrata]|uniref:Uncharacterized protein n=1 Tax=Polyplax serrata TaxID=468196 RepID=A0AAN8XMM3_POLSC